VDHFQHIYSYHAAEYHRMIAAEDVDGNLRAAIERVTPIAGKRLLDLGTGTGRLPLLLARQAAQMAGLDLHQGMLRENAAQRARNTGHWSLVQGDMRSLPFSSGWADVILAGWAMGHFQAWYASDWADQATRVLSEMRRVARPGGALVIIETLTTGALEPAAPHEGLARYYAWLEGEQGFCRQTIRTDYAFGSVEQAVAQTEFFFGAALAEKIRAHGWARLPEWTGVWSKPL
jgi:ubiquinone/menaquinone biosynthesis C-methylase UbiE